MGGAGSGNRWRVARRDTCEASLRIDIRYMRAKGLLKAGHRGTLSWSRGGEQTGWIEYRYHGATLELDYKARPAGGEWVKINEHIWLQRAGQPFGGERLYMCCPGCQRRCLVLYGGIYFRCRKCQNLGYATQREDTLGRLCARSSRIRNKLGDTGSFDDLFPTKPKGMHWKTYDRLKAEGERIEDSVAFAFDGLLRRYRSRF